MPSAWEEEKFHCQLLFLTQISGLREHLYYSCVCFSCCDVYIQLIECTKPVKQTDKMNRTSLDEVNAVRNAFSKPFSEYLSVFYNRIKSNQLTSCRRQYATATNLNWRREKKQPTNVRDVGWNNFMLIHTRFCQPFHNLPWLSSLHIESVVQRIL